MSEEEIIKYIKDEIEDDTDLFHWFDDVPDNNTRKQIQEMINAHQGLLELYYKEKEKNKILRQDKLDLIKEHNVVKMKDVQEELLSMRNALEIKQAEMEMQNNIIDNFYISKDKIKEKIKYNEVFNDDIHRYTCITLKELLGE